MQMDDSLLKNEELVVLRLRQLYRSYGYSCYKMSKFEEYDLYSRNKNFLVSDHVITFTDTDGKLLALKPDVTLSIVKNYRGQAGVVQRLYYNENVFRVSDKSQGYQEIMQTGIECLGQMTDYTLYEVLTLAALSLQVISARSVLTVSHLGILSSILPSVPGADREELLRLLGQKNAHELAQLCQKWALPEKQAAALAYMASAYGPPEEVLPALMELADNPELHQAAQQLQTLVQQAREVSGGTILVDLSLVGDMHYYNGIVLGGYVEGVPTCVLQGGQYDELMEKLGKEGGAIGFAVYLDQLERLKPPATYDVDTLLLCSPEDDPGQVERRASALRQAGESVSVQTAMPESLSFRHVEQLERGGGRNG